MPLKGFLWIVVCLFFFARSYSSYFVADDYEFLGRVDLSSAARYFHQSWGYGNEYRPLVAYSYAIDRALGGESPWPYHLTNTLLHSATALLAAMTARLSGRPKCDAAALCVLFAINPAAHESVLWIAGRPVVLSAFFMAAGLWALARTQRAGPLTYASFLAALLSYEGAVVFPLLSLLLPQIRARRLAGLAALALFYIAAWNLFFHCRITRFPVETSAHGALASLAACVLYVFHGAHRPAIAAVCLLLLAILLRHARNRPVAAFAMAWIVAAYLPFLFVRGFAGRFAYTASAAAALLLSTAIGNLYRKSRWPGLILFGVTVCFWGAGMQNRITMWREAGQMAREIVDAVKFALPSLPPGATIVITGVPDMHQHAYVFLTGLERAIARRYPQSQPLRVLRHPPAPQGAILLRYANGRVLDEPQYFLR